MSSADQHRQRVTVVSPFGQHEVDVLVDVPASGLLPDLLAMAGLHPSQVKVGSEGWRLEDADGNAVPPGRTLAEYGIMPGDVIQLCGLQHPEPAGDAPGLSRGDTAVRGGPGGAGPDDAPAGQGGPDLPWLGADWDKQPKTPLPGGPGPSRSAGPGEPWSPGAWNGPGSGAGPLGERDPADAPPRRDPASVITPRSVPVLGPAEPLAGEPGEGPGEGLAESGGTREREDSLSSGPSGPPEASPGRGEDSLSGPPVPPGVSAGGPHGQEDGPRPGLFGPPPGAAPPGPQGQPGRLLPPRAAGPLPGASGQPGGQRPGLAGPPPPSAVGWPQSPGGGPLPGGPGQPGGQRPGPSVAAPPGPAGQPGSVPPPRAAGPSGAPPGAAAGWPQGQPGGVRPPRVPGPPPGPGGVPQAAPVPPRGPAPQGPPDREMSPLQRTEAVLPSKVGQMTRMTAAVTAFFQGPSSPAAELAAARLRARQGSPAARAGDVSDTGGAGGPGSGDPGPGQDEPGAPGWNESPAEELRQRGEGGRHRLLPADLTVAAPPTRAECARDRWRELDHLGQLDSRITEPRLRHCATIAIVSPKGGVGKTTVTALLGTLFSLLRRDPTVAVDTNPDFGSLGRVLTPDQSWYVDDLARLVAEDDELSLTALDSQLGRVIHGLLVVPAPTDPSRMASLDEDAYGRVITRLKDFFSLILLDCGTGLQDPASAAAVAAADQVVLLTDAQPATASLVAQSAELLEQSRRPITVVVNRMPARGARLDLEQLSRFLPAARGLVVIPDQVPAATRLAGGSFDWRDAPPGWQLAVRQLAVVLVSDWRRLGLAQ